MAFDLPGIVGALVPGASLLFPDKKKKDKHDCDHKAELNACKACGQPMQPPTDPRVLALLDQLARRVEELEGKNKFEDFMSQVTSAANRNMSPPSHTGMPMNVNIVG